MERKRKVVKVHFSFDQFSMLALCGTKTRVGNVTSNSKEVTCGNCKKKLIVKRKIQYG